MHEAIREITNRGHCRPSLGSTHLIEGLPVCESVLALTVALIFTQKPGVKSVRLITLGGS